MRTKLARVKIMFRNRNNVKNDDNGRLFCLVYLVFAIEKSKAKETMNFKLLSLKLYLIALINLKGIFLNDISIQSEFILRLNKLGLNSESIDRSIQFDDILLIS